MSHVCEAASYSFYFPLQLFYSCVIIKTDRSTKVYASTNICKCWLCSFILFYFWGEEAAIVI
jgi:hypothetical protein